MNRDLSIIKVTEKFSFIRTINIYSHQNDCQENKYSATVDAVDEKLTHCQSTVSWSDDKTNNLATISNNWYSIDNLKSNSPSEVFDYQYPEESNKTKTNSFNNFLDKFLVIFAGSYLFFTLWLVFGSQNALFPIGIFNRKEISPADIEFVEYMKDSLANIERQTAKKQSSTATTSSKKETSEIVYVPIYTPTKTIKPNSNINFPQTIVPPPLPPQQLASAINPPISKISIEPPPPPSESIETKTKPIETTEIKETPEVAAVVKPNITYTLIGVMELKEGSAALFKIDGVTQRIWIGEKIENTDWILDSVVEQKAVIRNNKSTLTLSVGESLK